jgi:succinate dehydrogenase / fumarate reductase flavoprotein subunit/fumarate reductase flavoprotein subunit
MGGVRINRDGFTNLQGLLAAGEDSSGVHGANRLGGNGVAESTVFGARIGDVAAQFIKQRKHTALRQDQIAEAKASAEQFLVRKQGEDAWAVREELGRVMWENAGIVRSGAKLRVALEELAALSKRSASIAAPGGRAFNLTWQQALDLRNLVMTSELIARSALMREDSRGAHYREDFPNTDNANWLKNIYLARDGQGAKLWTESVKLTRLKPPV